jgi:hypothetical protein
MAPKDHTVDDSCDGRHCDLVALKTKVDTQDRLLWAILVALVGGLIKIFFGG